MFKKRWICLFVENDIGVLARISGLFSGKSYNLDSLTVGVTEDETVSRMTIGLTSDDRTFEQVKKQLNRCVEVIKVVDLTDTAVHIKELLFIKINDCEAAEQNALYQISERFGARVIDCGPSSVLLESVQPEPQSLELIRFLSGLCPGRIEVTRGGSVAVEAIMPK